MKDAVLGIFAKPPVAGRVKTRLCPPLTPEEAAEFYRVALSETVRTFGQFDGDLVLFHAGTPDYFLDTFPATRLLPQAEGDLGVRIDRALGGLLDDGYRRAALIGSDSPDLKPELVNEAFAALSGHDAVTIPSSDGGYVLIGESYHHSDLFRDIPWSTPGVLATTQRRALDHGIALASVGEWKDCDDWPTVLELLKRSPDTATAQHVRTTLAAYL